MAEGDGGAMAEGDGALVLPAPLAIRCVSDAAPRDARRWGSGSDEDEDEEKESDVGRRASSGYEGLRYKVHHTKECRQRAGSDGATASEEDDDTDGGSGSERSQLKLRYRVASPSSATASSQAMRSPSRLAASLLVGRDRMARAARAWRDGARRAGLFGADEDEDVDDEENEVKAGPRSVDNGLKRVAELEPTTDTPNNSPTALEEPVPTSNQVDFGQDPAVDEPPVVHSPHADSPRAAIACSVGVPRLVPSRLAPATRVPKMAQLWALLDRIECIAIRDVFTTHDDDDSGVTVHYVLDVYNYQEQHSLPTRRYHGTVRRSLWHPNSGSAPPLRKPDYHIEHRFSSFIKLRNRILRAVQLKHPNARAFPTDIESVSSSHHRNCAYCRRVALFIASGTESVAPLGWRTKFFTTVEMRKTLLSQFISELVFLAREQRDTCSNLATLTMMAHPPNRHVHRSVPGMLRRFLMVQTGENFMR